MQDIKTVGDHIRVRRLQKGLMQLEVAQLLGVTEDSITNWENNRSKPYVIYFPKIIHFLGYVPVDIDISTLGNRIKGYRYLHGLSQRKLAVKLGVDESTVNDYENNKHKPMPKIYKILNRFGIN